MAMPLLSMEDPYAMMFRYSNKKPYKPGAIPKPQKTSLSTNATPFKPLFPVLDSESLEGPPGLLTSECLEAPPGLSAEDPYAVWPSELWGQDFGAWSGAWLASHLGVGLLDAQDSPWESGLASPLSLDLPCEARDLFREVCSMITANVDRMTLAKELDELLEDFTPDQLCGELVQLLERLLKHKQKPSASPTLLAAIRDILVSRGVLVDAALAELILGRYHALKLHDEFNDFLPQLDAGVLADPGVGALVMKVAIKEGVLESAMERFRALCGLWRKNDPPGAPQCLVQQLVRLAAQQNSLLLPDILAELADIRITCETLNTMLFECHKCGDLVSFHSVERQGRVREVHFNTLTYCILLRQADSSEVMGGLLDEAMMHGARTKFILDKAADLAVETGNIALADAILQRVSVSTPSNPNNHAHAIEVLEKFDRGVSTDGDAAKQTSGATSDKFGNDLPDSITGKAPLETQTPRLYQ